MGMSRPIRVVHVGSSEAERWTAKVQLNLQMVTSILIMILGAV